MLAVLGVHPSLISLDPEEDGSVRADANRWKQVVWNEVTEVIGHMVRVDASGNVDLMEEDDAPPVVQRQNFRKKSRLQRSKVS